MRKTIFIVGQKAKNIHNMKWNQTKDWITQYWFKIGLSLLVVFMLNKKDLNLELNLSATPPSSTATFASYEAPVEEEGWMKKLSKAKIATSLSNIIQKEEKTTIVDEPEIVKSIKLSKAEIAKDEQMSILAAKDNLSNTYSNMTYHPADKKKTTKVSARKALKIKKQKKYVERFAGVAQSEMRKYGIPASIKLAQGLIESNAGASRLTQKNSNHFGMKCFSRNCGKGHCSNFTDDIHKDFFRIYKSAWASYRAHSIMLQNKRYKPLYKLKKNDYKAWAYGLKKAGYATDKKYAEKLINIIEELGLHEYDRI